MTETYYEYQPDTALLDIEEDDVYDHVYEREQYRKLAHSMPRCMKTMGAMAATPEMADNEEHFTTDETMMGSGWMKHVLIIIVILVVLYFIYSSVCGGGDSGEMSGYNPNRTYAARFVR